MIIQARDGSDMDQSSNSGGDEKLFEYSIFQKVEPKELPDGLEMKCDKGKSKIIVLRNQ